MHAQLQQLQAKARPLSQTRSRPTSGVRTAQNNSNAANNQFSFCQHQSPTSLEPIKQRSFSSKLRPVSGMNSLIRRKLPDCFILDVSPLSKKHIELTSIKDGSNQIRNSDLSPLPNQRFFIPQDIPSPPNVAKFDKNTLELQFNKQRPPLNPARLALSGLKKHPSSFSLHNQL